MIIEDLDAGITDDFKSDAVKFNVQNNLVPSENRSLRLRNGVSVFDWSGNSTHSVVAVDTIDNKPVQFISTDAQSFVRVLGDNRKYIPDQIIKGYPQLTNHIVTSDEWRSALFFNATSNAGVTQDIGRIVLADTGIVAEKASLPTATVVATNNEAGRLWAIVIERKYTDVNGFIYREYSPDVFGQFKGAVTTPTATEYVFTVEVRTSLPLSSIYQSSLRAVLFVSQINGSVLYRAKEISLPASIPVGSPATEYTSTAQLRYSPTAALDLSMPTNEIGQFFSEEAKLPLPKADHIKIVNNTLWLLGITDNTGTRRPYRLYQSVSGMPTSVIANAFYDFQSNGTGLANLNGKLIAGTDGFVYRVDGSIGIDGTGNIQAEPIIGSDQGCISGRSMVAVGNNLFYCGNDGVYSTDGFTATNITGRQLHSTYRELIGNKSDWKNIVSAYDSFDDLVYWVMPDNRLLILSLRSGGFSTGTLQNMEIVGVKACNIPIQSLVGKVVSSPSNGVITVANPYNYTQGEVYTFIKEDDSAVQLEAYAINGNTIELREEDFTAIEYTLKANQPIYEYGESNSDGKFGVVYRQHVLMASSLGYTVQLRDDHKSDVILKPLESDVSKLDRKSREFELLSAGISYDAPNDHKWVKDATFNLRSNGVISAVPFTVIDNRSLYQYMGEIVSNNKLVSFDKFNIYNRQSVEFDAKGIQTFRRHIPSGSCKCRFNQIGIKSTATNLYSSKEYSVLTVAPHSVDANKVTMTIENRFSSYTADNIKFPRNIKGMKVSIARAIRVICEELKSVVVNVDGTVDITWVARNPYKAIIGAVVDGTDISGGKYYSGTVKDVIGNDVTISFKSTEAVDSIVFEPIVVGEPLSANSVYFTPKKEYIGAWSSQVEILEVDEITEETITTYKPAGVEFVNEFYEFVIYGTPVDQDIEIASIGLAYANLSNSNAGKKAGSNMSGGFNGR